MKRICFIIMSLWLAGWGTACVALPFDWGGQTITPTPSASAGPTPTPIPAAPVTFNVTLPAPILPDETLYLSLVDEVTGLGLNPRNYPMQMVDATHYTLTLPFPIGSVVTYRYLRQAVLPVFEDDAYGQPVRYRMYHVVAPGIVDDIVTSWSDTPFTGATGRVSGRVVNAVDGRPVPGLLIAVGGQQTLTDSTGYFLVDGLLPGVHNLVAFAPDGAYQTFQQGALVAEGKNTPAEFAVTPSQFVTVTFLVHVPADTVENAPLRIAGNLTSLGNTFANLNAGFSTVASRMPTMTFQGNRRYSLTLSLPAGIDIRYKYTLGDGYWNAEHAPDGSFVLRQLIVPEGVSTFLVEEFVSTWRDGSSAPILFEAEAPPETPASDIVSIQFKPYGWAEPIPMWPLGNRKWMYRLYSPLRSLSSFEYRYCRNDQCGIANDAATASSNFGRPVTPSLTPQTLKDTITAWQWLQPNMPNAVVGLPVMPHPGNFWAGVEFLPATDPTWHPWMPQAILTLKSLSANWAVLTPSWTVKATPSFQFAPVPGYDASLQDLTVQINALRSLDIQVALFPQARLPALPLDWWRATNRDELWWQTWFERYQAFVISYADLAQQTGAAALILGGEWVEPALPGGKIGDQPSGVPENATERWQEILQAARNRFGGSILWAVSYPDRLNAVPDTFLANLDGIYLLWYAPLSNSNNPTTDEMSLAFGQLLDAEIKPFQERLGKPLILAVAYPSVDGAATAWMPLPTALKPGNGQGTVDLTEQADIYQALLVAVNQRPWIGGFVSRGFYPPVIVHDTSASVYGKPAAGVLWYWYPRLLGLTP